MGDERFGRDDEEFGFGEVQLEVVRFIQAEMSVRQASILAEIPGSVGGNDR